MADGCDAAPEPAVAARLRVKGPVAPARSAGHVRDTISPDIVWLRGAERLDDAVLTELGEALAARGGRLMCETSLAALDRVAAAIPPSVPTEWLVEADSADRLMAVAALQSPRLMAVNVRTVRIFSRSRSRRSGPGRCQAPRTRRPGTTIATRFSTQSSRRAARTRTEARATTAPIRAAERRFNSRSVLGPFWNAPGKGGLAPPTRGRRGL